MGPSAASTIKIVALGASNTAGWGVGDENSYPTQLQAMLRAKGYHAQVLNAGKSFDTTTGMLARLDAAVPAGTSIVIVQPGGNDTRFFGSKRQRAENLAAIEQRLHARNIKVIVFENTIVPSDLYQWDGIHFTREGHKVAASYLAQPRHGLDRRRRSPLRSPNRASPGRSRAQDLISRSHSSSLSTLTPSFCASPSLEPAPGPATT